MSNELWIERVNQIKKFLLSMQEKICTQLSAIDGQTFLVDNWQRAEGGEGRSCVLENGNVIERGGVNFSHVFGTQLPPSASLAKPELAGSAFQALGISIVIHPRNPYAPTSHANVRFFIAQKPNQEPVWWFGGGFDLTPYYGFEEDCVHWHQMAKKACEPFGKEIYPLFKKQCDDYFYLKHRQEARGIGGIFFDDLHAWGFEKSFSFLKNVIENYLSAYVSLLEKRKDHIYGEREREFQLYRRGRYIEFNLIFDRGTLFGLQSNGRTESILVSMPPLASWKYDWHPEKNSAEIKLYEKFLPARDWLAEL